MTDPIRRAFWALSFRNRALLIAGSVIWIGGLVAAVVER